MGCSSNKENSENQDNYTINESKSEQKYIKQENPIIENISDIFREEEIALINQRKFRRAQDKSVEKNQNKIYPLYQKIKVDLSKQEKTVTNYMVLYIPKDYSQLKPMKYTYYFYYNRTLYPIKENYNLVSSNPKTIKGYGSFSEESEETRDFACVSANIQFTISQNDIKNEFIVLTTTYIFDFESYYGFCDFHFSFDREDENLAVPKSVLFIINDNYNLNNESHKEEEFISLKKNELFSFNRKDFSIKFFDKSKKIDIRNEVDEELLLNFTDKDIEKINFSLNLRKWEFGTDNLIYHKVIHNIKHNKDYIKLYYVIFSPIMNGKSGPEQAGEGGYDEDYQEPIIIKEFKINDTKVKKDGEEDCSENQYGHYGYFISDEKQLEFGHSFRKTFSICELDCESNENVNYFKLKLASFIEGVFFDLGSSFYYEIILNGNSIKFSDKNFKYQIKNDKIILDGYLDDYDEQKYIEVAKNTNNPKYYLELSNKEKHSEWKFMRGDNLIPDKMELI